MARPKEIPERVHLLLQRVADGQASEGDLEQFAELVAEDPALADELERLESFSRVMHQELSRAAQGVDFRAMQAAVMQQIDRPEHRKVSLRERLAVIVRESLQHQRALWAPLSAVAAAAVIAMVGPALVSEPTQAPGAGSLARGPEIHSLDTESTTAVVFQNPDSDVAVIWLAGVEPDLDEEEEEELNEELNEDDTATP